MGVLEHPEHLFPGYTPEPVYPLLNLTFTYVVEAMCQLFLSQCCYMIVTLNEKHLAYTNKLKTIIILCMD